MSSNFYRQFTLVLVILIFLFNIAVGVSSAIVSGGMSISSTVLVLLSLVLVLAVILAVRASNCSDRNLMEAMGKVASGELGRRLPVTANDEPGKLAQAFNEMTVNLNWMVSRLSEDRSRLQTILSTMSDGVIMTDKNGNVVLANPAAERFFGFRREECLGCPLTQLIHDHEVDELLKQCIKEEGQQSMQLESRQAKQFFRVVAYPLLSDRLTGVLLLFQDLTEVRNLQAVRREFVANVSHELKTPLASIKAIVETLQNGALDEKEVAGDFVSKINDEVNSMIEMVSELLELSRIEMGKAELKLEPVNLNTLIRDTIIRLGTQAERQQLTVTMEPALGLPPVSADKEMVGEVVTNILQNAIKFTPPGGKVKVHTGVEGGEVVVSISDTGIGIGPKDLPHIFERFYKADKARNSAGTGLGLSIAKHVIQVHGGRIWVESEPGKGSTFTFTLPLNPSPQKIAAA